MADGIKIGNLDISAFKVGSSDCKIYLGDTLLYPQSQPPTPPTPTFKWLATYSDSHTESAECDSSSAITDGEINTRNLVSIEIGGTCVTSIGEYAFDSCRSLTSCTIGNSVTSIGMNAFTNCSSLTSIDIPDSVTSIGYYAFLSCYSLTSITVNAVTPPSLGNMAFDSTNNCPIYVPSGSVSAYQSAWSGYSPRIQAIPNS